MGPTNTKAGFICVGKSQRKNNFFKVRESSGNFGKYRGIFEICKNVMDLSGNIPKGIQVTEPTRSFSPSPTLRYVSGYRLRKNCILLTAV